MVWSEVDAGTEVELRVPASTAYATEQRSSWFSRKAKHKVGAHDAGISQIRILAVDDHPVVRQGSPV